MVTIDTLTRHTPEIFPGFHSLAISVRNIRNFPSSCKEQPLTHCTGSLFASPLLSSRRSFLLFGGVKFHVVRDLLASWNRLRKKRCILRGLESFDVNLGRGLDLGIAPVRDVLLSSPTTYMIQSLPDEKFWKHLCIKLMRTTLVFVEIGFGLISAPSNSMGPTKGVRNLPSHGDFVCASLS